MHILIVFTILLIPYIMSFVKNIVPLSVTGIQKQPSSLVNQYYHARLSPLFSTTSSDSIGSANLDWPNLG